MGDERERERGGGRDGGRERGSMNTCTIESKRQMGRTKIEDIKVRQGIGTLRATQSVPREAPNQRIICLGFLFNMRD